MTTLASLWLPVLLSAVFVFVASSLIHMVLGTHKGDYKKLPDEAGVLDALRRLAVTPGQYMFPSCGSMKEMGSPEMLEKWKTGPVGTLIVRPSGFPGMGGALGTWFLYCLVVSVFVAYLAGLALAPGAAGMQVFRIAATVALPVYALSNVPESIWKGVSWSTTARFVFDGIVYALVTGAAFAWMWPAAGA